MKKKHEKQLSYRDFLAPNKRKYEMIKRCREKQIRKYTFTKNNCRISRNEKFKMETN